MNCAVAINSQRMFFTVEAALSQQERHQSDIHSFPLSKHDEKLLQGKKMVLQHDNNYAHHDFFG